jgi:hypothetical protein
MTDLDGIDQIEPVSCDPELLYFRMVMYTGGWYSTLYASPDIQVYPKNSGYTILLCA